MQNTLLKVLISSAYEDKSKVLIDSSPLTDCNEDQLTMIENFHMVELYLIEGDDEYFCGIRADHFCVEYGWSEFFTNNDSDGRDTDLVLITANHKGFRVMTLLKLN